MVTRSPPLKPRSATGTKTWSSRPALSSPRARRCAASTPATAASTTSLSEPSRAFLTALKSSRASLCQAKRGWGRPCGCRARGAQSAARRVPPPFRGRPERRPSGRRPPSDCAPACRASSRAPGARRAPHRRWSGSRSRWRSRRRACDGTCAGRRSARPRGPPQATSPQRPPPVERLLEDAREQSAELFGASGRRQRIVAEVVGEADLRVVGPARAPEPQRHRGDPLAEGDS